MSTPDAEPDALHVATLNVRNFADRWDERLPLLLADMRALQPDVIGLQEVIFSLQQDRLMGAAGAAAYRTIRGSPEEPEIGNSLLVQERLLVCEVGRLELGLGRYAIGATVEMPGGLRARVVVTHLHYVVAERETRATQVDTLEAWLEGRRGPDATVVIGDFNAEPSEPAYARMLAAGFRSAHAEANGHEPAVTWPSGLQPPAPGDYAPGCFDYIWVRGDVTTDSCALVFDRPAFDDPGLLPSDHFGLAARLSVGGG
ncbi:MAG: endonuclease/exonuclease/phosphatase family protein [Chloroflexi bacterium]|nr:endonuclease/exonuclease/phosphatase family protein [Chloroflexota bacterium]